MGRTFFDRTMPSLVRQLERLNANLEGPPPGEVDEEALGAVLAQVEDLTPEARRAVLLAALRS